MEALRHHINVARKCSHHTRNMSVSYVMPKKSRPRSMQGVSMLSICRNNVYSTIHTRTIHCSSPTKFPSDSSSSNPALSTTGDGTGVKATPLKLLPRPLGVATPPRWTKPTKEEKIQNFNDPERREHERKVLMKLNSQPYYADIHKIAFHGGKSWIAPERLIMEERSLYFPDLSGKPLATPPSPVDTSLSNKQRREELMLRGPHIPLTDGKLHTAQAVKGNVSIIAITNSQISEQHVKGWTQTAVEKWRGHEKFRFIQVNLQQNPLRTFVVSFFTSKLKQIVPPHFHHSYILSYDNIDYVRDAIGLENKYVGYVYLVDWNGRIRWAGCGGPWVGDGSTPEHPLSSSNPAEPASDSTSASAQSPVRQPTPKPRSIPEGGPGGQVMEGVVQGLGEVQRLERCLNVLMNRLDSEEESTKTS